MNFAATQEKSVSKTPKEEEITSKKQATTITTQNAAGNNRRSQKVKTHRIETNTHHD
jgi:hypothetical protein